MLNYFEEKFTKKAQYILPILVFLIIIILYIVDVYMPYVNDELFWLFLGIILVYISHIIGKYMNYLYSRIYTDSLTGLKNRGYFYANINKIINDVLMNENKYSLIMLDIDHFKKINDKFGHQEGDNVLIKLSLLLKKHLRESDCVFRWGERNF